MRFLLLLLASATLAAAAPAKPNILFIFSDDQRADTIAALGNAHIRTPNLDRLVKSGTTFTRAYCMGALQGAVCVPSRAMLMTGRTLFRLDEQMKTQPTWPEQFGKAGYRTFITGKWHNGADSVRRTFQEGKAIFLGGMTKLDPTTAPLQDLSPERTLVNNRPAGRLPVAVFTDAAVEFLRAQKGAEKPFLCYVPMNLPHDPCVAPPGYHAEYAAAKPPAPANFLPQHPFNNGALTIRDEALAPWPRTPEIVRQHLADYYATITFLDAEIGRMLDALREAGAEQNTIVVFASDHGLAIGSHGLFGKQNLYDHSMRAPLILAGPGIAKDKRSDAFAYLLDIYPTLGDLAGIPAPEGSEGLSLLPVIQGREKSVREAILTAYTGTQRAVRDDVWKLIAYPQVNKTQLFNLRDDPIEMHDLAAAPAHKADLDRMTALLQAMQEKAGDKQPLTTENPKPLDFDFPKAKAAKAAKTRRDPRAPAAPASPRP